MNNKLFIPTLLICLLTTGCQNRPPVSSVVISPDDSVEPSEEPSVEPSEEPSETPSEEPSTIDIDECLNIHFLEMNDCYGDSFLVKYKDYEILVDGGTQSDATTVRSALKKYVTDGVLDMLIVSHPHNDHTGGLSDRNTYREVKSIGTVIDYGYKYSTSWNEGYETQRDKYIDLGASYYPVYDLFHNDDLDSVFTISDGIELEVMDTGYYLSPDQEQTSTYNHNDTSIAVTITYNNTKFFFAGDLETKGENALMSKYPNYFKDYYTYFKASHHGSETSNSLSFLQYLKPEYIFISAALTAGNRTTSGVIYEQHPYIYTLRNFEKITDNVYWNGVNGTINASCDGNEIVKVSGDGSSYPYYHNGTQVEFDWEKDLPFPQTSFYRDYMKLK